MDIIYFVPTLRDGIWSVSADGGDPVQLTEPVHDGFDENHSWPSPLPDGKGLLYTRCLRPTPGYVPRPFEWDLHTSGAERLRCALR